MTQSYHDILSANFIGIEKESLDAGLSQKLYAVGMKEPQLLRPASTHISRWDMLLIAILATMLSTGCAPISRPSSVMQTVAVKSAVPPVGKSLVMIHRPRAHQGYGLYTGVWDSTNFIADLGNGHTSPYVCEPGKHYFINRSVERVGVVEAQLLPGQTYALRLDTAGAFIASFQIEPVKRGGKGRKDTEEWEKKNLWVVRGPAACEHEQLRRSEIELIIKDFVYGEKKSRVRHLDPEDHR